MNARATGTIAAADGPALGCSRRGNHTCLEVARYFGGANLARVAFANAQLCA